MERAKCTCGGQLECYGSDDIYHYLKCIKCDRKWRKFV